MNRGHEVEKRGAVVHGFLVFGHGVGLAHALMIRSRFFIALHGIAGLISLVCAVDHINDAMDGRP